VAGPTSLPSIWMSIGAGMPKFRICVTISAGKNRRSCREIIVDQPLAQRAHVVRGRVVILAQGDQDVGVVAPMAPEVMCMVFIGL
jgi:hypothetical protein